MKDFIQNDLTEWITPIISGIVEVNLHNLSLLKTKRLSTLLLVPQKSILFSYREEIREELACASLAEDVIL